MQGSSSLVNDTIPSFMYCFLLLDIPNTRRTDLLNVLRPRTISLLEIVFSK